MVGILSDNDPTLLDYGADIGGGTPLIRAGLCHMRTTTPSYTRRSIGTACIENRKWGTFLRGTMPVLLHYTWKDPRVVELLLDRGAEIDGDNSGKTPLHRAARFNVKAVVKQLWDRGADVARGDRGIACTRRQINDEEFLLDHGADIHAREWEYRSTLRNRLQPCAGGRGSDRGADVDARSGQTPCGRTELGSLSLRVRDPGCDFLRG